MNNQEFLKEVYVAIEKVVDQGEPSLGADGACVYLNHEGECCIVGHMMPNDEVRKEADSLPQPSLSGVIYEGIWGEGFTPKQVDLLDRLQIIHDEPSDYKEWDVEVQEFLYNMETYKELSYEVIKKWEESL